MCNYILPRILYFTSVCETNKRKKGAHFSSITVNSKSDFRELIIFVHESQIDKASSAHSTGPPSF